MLSEYNIKKAGEMDQIVFDYFKLHPKLKEIQVKDLMEIFVSSGVFSKDYKDGLPLRDFLKKIEENNSLDLFKQIKLIRKAEDKYWYFLKKAKK